MLNAVLNQVWIRVCIQLSMQRLIRLLKFGTVDLSPKRNQANSSTVAIGLYSMLMNIKRLRLYYGPNLAFAIVFSSLGSQLIASGLFTPLWECLETKNKWSWMAINGGSSPEISLWLGHSVDTHYRCDGYLYSKIDTGERRHETYMGHCINSNLPSSILESRWEFQYEAGNDERTVTHWLNKTNVKEFRTFICQLQEST